MTTYNLAVIGGDGIGPEVTAEALKALDAVAPHFNFWVTTTAYDLGAKPYLETGEVLPAAVLEELAGHDAILVGAVGSPEVPAGVLGDLCFLGLPSEAWWRGRRACRITA